MHNYTNEGDDEVREDSDKDESEDSDAVLQEILHASCGAKSRIWHRPEREYASQ